jgi:uncharacterized membrane protein
MNSSQMWTFFWTQMVVNVIFASAILRAWTKQK